MTNKNNYAKNWDAIFGKKAASQPKASEPKQPEASEPKYTTVTYHDGGKGLITRRCWDCGGSGRVYEGGYGMRDCNTCS